jgi:uncharacterized membrane protein YfcA
MSIEIIILLFGIGILAGILAGMFGVGGGIVIVPALIWVYGYTGTGSPYTVHAAIATSLFTIIFTSISSAVKHSSHGNVVYGAALIIGITSAVSVFVFSKIAVHLPAELLKILFSAVIVIAAVKFLIEKKTEPAENPDNRAAEYNKLYALITGMLTGIIAAFTGLGGGIFAVPLMHYLLKFDIKKAIGTSTLAVLITASAGVLGYVINQPGELGFPYYTLGLVDVYAALPVIAGSVPFAQAGVWINRKTRNAMLKKLFAVFILAVAAKLLFF